MYGYRLAIVLAAITVSGCTSLGNFNSVHRKLDTSEGSGVLIDIKQRAILVGKTSRDGKESTIVCAEPSPDALSAYAAELAAKVDRPELFAAQLTAGTQEGASFVGLRTSTIQLLRDSMYRLCEAHLNGAIDKNSYNFQLRKYQRQLVALLAIEQLTGAQRVSASGIETRSAAQIARDLKALQAESNDLKQSIDAIDVKLKDAKDNKDALTSERAALVQRKKDVDTAITQEREVLASGSTRVVFPEQNGSGSTTPSQSLNQTVLDIVSLVTDRNDTETQCLLLLIDYSKDDEAKRPPAGTDPVYDSCSKILKDYAEEKNSELETNYKLEMSALIDRITQLTERLKATEAKINGITSAAARREINSTRTQLDQATKALNQLLAQPRSDLPPDP